jgi:thiamine-monophosphate kinase
MTREPLDEFAEIARLYRPLTAGSPEALGLMDDVAVLPSRPGHDLVLTKDAMVEGVHFLPGEPLDVVARKLLRTNLSDLAAKAAEPHGYLLAVAWPRGTPLEAKMQFASGLAEDQRRFCARLLGGDTVSTAGPLVASLTLLGWTPAGVLVRRSGARPGHLVLVSGAIGDAGLGLELLQAGGDFSADGLALIERHRLPTPRLELRAPLRRFASAAADVSDGLVADAGHIAAASGCALTIELEALPLSEAAARWLEGQSDPIAGRVALATAGDDYEIVCTADPADAPAFIAAASEAGVRMTAIGVVSEGRGVSVRQHGISVPIARAGWTHG